MLVVFIVEFASFVDSILFVVKLIKCFWIVLQQSCRLRPVNFHKSVKDSQAGTHSHKANDGPQVNMTPKQGEHFAMESSERHVASEFNDDGRSRLNVGWPTGTAQPLVRQ